MSAKLIRISLALTLLVATAQAQWNIQDSHTTASLRGIDSVGGGVAWASGPNGRIGKLRPIALNQPSTKK